MHDFTYVPSPLMHILNVRFHWFYDLKIFQTHTDIWALIYRLTSVFIKILEYNINIYGFCLQRTTIKNIKPMKTPFTYFNFTISTKICMLIESLFFSIDPWTLFMIVQLFTSESSDYPFEETLFLVSEIVLRVVLL